MISIRPGTDSDFKPSKARFLFGSPVKLSSFLCEIDRLVVLWCGGNGAQSTVETCCSREALDVLDTFRWSANPWLFELKSFSMLIPSGGIRKPKKGACICPASRRGRRHRLGLFRETYENVTEVANSSSIVLSIHHQWSVAESLRYKGSKGPRATTT